MIMRYRITIELERGEERAEAPSLLANLVVADGLARAVSASAGRFELSEARIIELDPEGILIEGIESTDAGRWPQRWYAAFTSE